MPYYRWKGVNLLGDFKAGKSFAKDKEYLDTFLFNNNISLLECSRSHIWSVFRHVSVQNKIQLFRQLSVLLDAGVRLPEALQIAGNQAENLFWGQILHNVESDIQEGLSLGHALGKYPNIFNELIVKMVIVGQETGTLSVALHQLADYLERKNMFYKKVRSAAMLPLITLGFFVCISMTIFILVVPKFADMFKTFNKELPAITKVILKVSLFLRSNWFVMAIILFVLFILVIRSYIKTVSGKAITEKVLLSVPFVGSTMRYRFFVYFFGSISILLKSGMRLVPAIGVSKKSLQRSVFANYIEKLETDVLSGSSLSDSLADHAGSLFTQDIIAMVRVGEETGKLSLMLKKAADMYQEKVNRSLLFFTTIFQPLLMILLGLLITLLIFAIYVPVFNLSSLA